MEDDNLHYPTYAEIERYLTRHPKYFTFWLKDSKVNHQRMGRIFVMVHTFEGH